MLDGTYKMKMDTPMGSKEGTVILRTEGDKAYAHIDAPIIGKKEFECQASGDTFTFEGSFNIMLVGNVTFTGQGAVEGDSMHVTLKTDKGDFQIEGSRV